MKRGEEREDAENGYHNGGAFWRHPAKKKGVGLNGVIFFGGLNGLRSPTPQSPPPRRKGLQTRSRLPAYKRNRLSLEEWIGEFSLGERKKERKTESKGRGEHVVLHNLNSTIFFPIFRAE